jgi:hypothetical protein
MAWLLAVGEPSGASYDGSIRLVQVDGATVESYAPTVDLGVNNSQAPTRRQLTVVNNRVFFSSYDGRCYSVALADALAKDGVLADYAGVVGTPEKVGTVWALGSQYLSAGAITIINNPTVIGYSYTTYDGGLLSSTNGISFYGRDIEPGRYPIQLIKGESGAFFASVINGGGAFSTELWRSGDGVNWVVLAAGINPVTVLDAAGTSNGLWGIYCPSFYPGNLRYSTDDLATIQEMTAPAAFTRFWAFGTTLYAAAVGALYSSTNGTSWTSLGNPLGGSTSAIYDIAQDGSTYMIVGRGKAVTTTDFATYTNVTAYDFGGHLIYGVAVITAQTGGSTGGTIQGTLRLDTSEGAFAARTVYLYNYTTGDKVAQTTSDGATGAWSFTAVAPGDYFVVGAAQGDDLNIPRDFDALGVITVV